MSPKLAHNCKLVVLTPGWLLVGTPHAVVVHARSKNEVVTTIMIVNRHRAAAAAVAPSGGGTSLDANVRILPLKKFCSPHSCYMSQETRKIRHRSLSLRWTESSSSMVSPAYFLLIHRAV